MAVIHIVLLKFKSTTSEAVKREICDKALALKDVIPGITRGSAGKNFSNRAKGFEWGWVFEHASQKDLEVYTTHPSHLEFISILAPHKEDLLAFDYEA